MGSENNSIAFSAGMAFSKATRLSEVGAANWPGRQKVGRWIRFGATTRISGSDDTAKPLRRVYVPDICHCETGNRTKVVVGDDVPVYFRADALDRGRHLHKPGSVGLVLCGVLLGCAESWGAYSLDRAIAAAVAGRCFAVDFRCRSDCRICRESGCGCRTSSSSSRVLRAYLWILGAGSLTVGRSCRISHGYI